MNTTNNELNPYADEMPRHVSEVRGLRTYRIDGRYLARYSHDAEAFDYASGFTDGPDVVKLERIINNKWFTFSESHDGDGVWKNEIDGERIPCDE